MHHLEHRLAAGAHAGDPRFDAAFCASFPTVPMRVDAYTGAVNWPRYGWRGPDESQPKLPQLLRDAGYHTGLVLDTDNNVGAGLHTFYDEHYLIKKEVDDGVKAEDIVVPVPIEHVRQQARQYRSQRAEWAHFKHETDWFVARTMLRASQWLEDNAQRDKWFLWVDTFEIHEDYMPPKYMPWSDVRMTHVFSNSPISSACRSRCPTQRSVSVTSPA